MMRPTFLSGVFRTEADKTGTCSWDWKLRYGLNKATMQRVKNTKI